MPRWSRSVVFSSLLVIVASVTAAGAAPLRVDLSPDNGRSDVLTPKIENWAIKDGPSSERTFGSVRATLRATGAAGATVGAGWWKSGYDTGATLASDGAIAKSGAGLELTLRGLAPGPHTLVTWHSVVDNVAPLALRVQVGEAPAQTVIPTKRVLDDSEAASLVSSVTVAGDAVVVVKISAADGASPAILNGFAIDIPDPAKVAARPSPSNDDWHTEENPRLSWRAGRGAVVHRVYLGTSAAAVAAATPASPEFKGEVTATTFATHEVDFTRPRFWRIDEVDASGVVTPGEVWNFQIRRLAFPGAEGYGRFAIGGRGGRVIEVTNLNDDGPGSLRAAVEAEGPRTVVFRVGGAIWLKSKLIIRNPYLTIAGQTAPGDGIALYGATVGTYATNDVILRYLRIRVGDASGQTMDGAGMGVGTDHSIMDHCSISWSIDEAFSSRMARNITLQRTLIAEPLNLSVHSHYVGTGKGHSFAGSVSGDIASLHHNLIVNAAGRNWSLAGGLNKGGGFAGRLDIRNNVVYNWQHRTTDGGVKALNMVGNYYIPGPASKVFHLLMPDFGSPKDPQQYYLAGNRMEGRPQYDADNWANGAVKLQEKSLDDIKLSAAAVLKLIKVDQPFWESYVTPHTADEAYASVIADVGANYPRYDSVDQRALHDVTKRTTTAKGSKTGTPGIIDSQKDVGGYPEMKGGEAPPDTDHDGLSDAWEIAQGLDPKDASDGARFTASGYTNLERYLNELPTLRR